MRYVPGTRRDTLAVHTLVVDPARSTLEITFAVGVTMDLFELVTHSFVVKVWREQTGEGKSLGKWRGYILHVSTNERRYISDFDDITAFIAPYLQAMNVKLRWSWRLREWLRQWKRSK